MEGGALPLQPAFGDLQARAAMHAIAAIQANGFHELAVLLKGSGSDLWLPSGTGSVLVVPLEGSEKDSARK